jgi:hypothetical protein
MSVLNRIELSFWNLVIPLIHGSKIVRFLMQGIYTTLAAGFFSRFFIPASLSALLGLVLGYIAGVVSNLW